MHGIIQVVRVQVRVTCPVLPNDQKKFWRCGRAWESGHTVDAEFLVVPNSSDAPSGCVSEVAFRGLLEEKRLAVMVLSRELMQHTLPPAPTPEIEHGLFDDLLAQKPAKK